MSFSWSTSLRMSHSSTLLTTFKSCLKVIALKWSFCLHWEKYRKPFWSIEDMCIQFCLIFHQYCPQSYGYEDFPSRLHIWLRSLWRGACIRDTKISHIPTDCSQIACFDWGGQKLVDKSVRQFDETVSSHDYAVYQQHQRCLVTCGQCIGHMLWHSAGLQNLCFSFWKLLSCPKWLLDTVQLHWHDNSPRKA